MLQTLRVQSGYVIQTTDDGDRRRDVVLETFTAISARFYMQATLLENAPGLLNL